MTIRFLPNWVKCCWEQPPRSSDVDLKRVQSRKANPNNIQVKTELYDGQMESIEKRTEMKWWSQISSAEIVKMRKTVNEGRSPISSHSICILYLSPDHLSLPIHTYQHLWKLASRYAWTSSSSSIQIISQHFSLYSLVSTVKTCWAAMLCWWNVGTWYSGQSGASVVIINVMSAWRSIEKRIRSS